MNFTSIIKQIYYPNNIICTNIKIESESKDYDAHACIIDNKNILFRTANITPTKEGQFVTLYKRSSQGPIIPYDMADDFDIVIINVNENEKSGQFIFNKNSLLQNKVFSKNNIGGKRALRVYPSWCNPSNKTAQKTQAWQLQYFVETTNINDQVVKKIKTLLTS